VPVRRPALQEDRPGRSGRPPLPTFPAVAGRGPRVSWCAVTAPVDELLPRAREIAAERGETPPKNALKTSLGIGWKKAVALHERLSAEVAVETPAAGPGEGVPGGGSTSPDPLPDRPDPTPAETVFPQADGSPDLSPVVSRRVSRPWPILVLALPAFVAIWSGWVDLGRLTGFGVVHPLPGHLGRSLDQHGDHVAGRPGGIRVVRAAGVAGRGSLGPCDPVRDVVFPRVSPAGRGRAGHLSPVGVYGPVADHDRGVLPPVLVLGMGAALYHLAHRP
jgi:hypothetical protein